MKLFASSHIKKIEIYDINGRQSRATELMYAAAQAFASWFSAKVDLTQKVHVLCGNGNNGADGLVISEILNNLGYQITIYCPHKDQIKSTLFKKHYSRLIQRKDVILKSLEIKCLPRVYENTVFIDALLGIGVNRAIDGPIAEIIKFVNRCAAPVYSVDMPSGLLAEGITDAVTIHAEATLSFEFPKLSFFLKENQGALGEWEFRAIGIKDSLISQHSTNYFLLDKTFITSKIKIRDRFSHKGTYGHVALIAGQPGMSGAAVLSAKASLVSGVGLVSMYGSEQCRTIFQSQVPEALFKEIQSLRISNIFTYVIGPGITNNDTYLAKVIDIISASSTPLVLDAGALNLLSTQKESFSILPKYSILTPHPKEFSRLAGVCKNSDERLQRQIEFSKKYKVIVVLKDHYTTITSPEGHIYYNISGNPGLATGGSGDVLTGMIGAFLAQGYKPIEAACIGVFLHGHAADSYVQSYDQLSLTPSILINQIKNVIKTLYGS